MEHNVEIKASVSNFSILYRKAENITDMPPVVIQQMDTFYRVLNGRLKLREIQGSTTQLIWYDRPNKSGPKTSNFTITKVADPLSMKSILSAALGEIGCVKKKRTLFMVGPTRIHLDEVEGLGCFLEFEVYGQTLEAGTKIARDLMEKLGVKETDLLESAYMDMILEKTQRQSGD